MSTLAMLFGIVIHGVTAYLPMPEGPSMDEQDRQDENTEGRSTGNVEEPNIWFVESPDCR